MNYTSHAKKIYYFSWIEFNKQKKIKNSKNFDFLLCIRHTSVD